MSMTDDEIDKAIMRARHAGTRHTPATKPTTVDASASQQPLPEPMFSGSPQPGSVIFWSTSAIGRFR